MAVLRKRLHFRRFHYFERRIGQEAEDPWRISIKMMYDSHLGASQQPRSTPLALLMAQPTASSATPGEKNVLSLSTRPHPLGFA